MEQLESLEIEDVTPFGLLTLYAAESRLNGFDDLETPEYISVRLCEFMKKTNQHIETVVDPKTNKNILQFTKTKKLWRLFR
jgi:hypothetical protein